MDYLDGLVSPHAGASESVSFPTSRRDAYSLVVPLRPPTLTYWVICDVDMHLQILIRNVKVMRGN